MKFYIKFLVCCVNFSNDYGLPGYKIAPPLQKKSPQTYYLLQTFKHLFEIRVKDLIFQFVLLLLKL